MTKLTVKFLKAMKSGTLIGRGLATVNGTEIKWLAVRGKVVDWAIYYSTVVASSYDFVKENGLKMGNEKSIRALVSCDDAAFARYRY